MVALRRHRSRTRRGARRGSRYGGSKRTFTWVRDVRDSIAVAAGGATGVSIVPDTGLDPGARIGATVTRVFIQLKLVHPDDLHTQNPAQTKFFLGLIVLPQNFVPGADQGPSNASHLDWFAWRAFDYTLSPNYTASVAGTPGTIISGHVFDVRSQRILHDQLDVPWLFISNRSAVAVTFGYAASTLLKRV